MLDTLPDINFNKYLGLVAKHTGYSPRVVLYTRLALYERDEQLRLLQQDQELVGKLRRKGINAVAHIVGGEDEASWDYYTPIPTVPPKSTFLGDDVSPRRGFLGLKPITEPQEPGIGIHFIKGEKDRDPTRNTRTWNLYVRLVYPATAIITGLGENIRLDSLNTFDQALTRGFKNPHYKEYVHVYRGGASWTEGRQGNG